MDMQFQLFLLFFFFFHTTAFFNHNQTNSSVNVELYQCNTNETIVSNAIIIIDKVFDSCDLNCCTKNDSNQTIYLNTCQVSIQSSTNVCLGRFCYSDPCNQFLLSMNTTFNQTMKKNNMTIINKIHSSFSWPSFVNTTRITWPLWRDKNDLSIRYNILTLLLIVNLSLTLITSFIVIKSIRHAKILAERKSRRYSLF